MEVGNAVVIFESAVIIEIVDIVHVKNFFRMKDIEFFTGLCEVFRECIVVDDISEVVEDIEEFHEHPLV